MTKLAGIPEIIAAIQGVVGTVAGVRWAPDVPPDQLAGLASVFAVCAPATGSYAEVTSGRVEADHALHLLVATPAANRRTDAERLAEVGDAVALALLAAGTLGAGLILETERINYTYGPLTYAEQPCIGYLFELHVLAIGGLS